MNLEIVVKNAWAAYSRKEYKNMIAYASQLAAAGDPWAVQGYFLRGMANEHWAEGPEDRLRSAIGDYRRAAILAPHANAYQNLARALMKAGHSHYDEAYRYLLEGWSLEQSAELMLGFGSYFQTRPSPDLDQALKFYKRAALRGRFRGFMAAAQLCRSTGHHSQAMVWDLVRIAFSPLIWLLHGRRAMFEF